MSIPPPTWQEADASVFQRVWEMAERLERIERQVEVLIGEARSLKAELRKRGSL